MFYWFADSKESKASSSSPPLNKSKEELSYSKKLFSLLELDFGTKMLSWFERNGSIFSVTFGGWAMIPSFIKSLILSLWIMISPNVGSYWIESFLISLWIRPAAILSNISASESIYDVAVLKLLFELYSLSFIDIGLLWANGSKLLPVRVLSEHFSLGVPEGDTVGIVLRRQVGLLLKILSLREFTSNLFLVSESSLNPEWMLLLSFEGNSSSWWILIALSGRPGPWILCLNSWSR